MQTLAVLIANGGSTIPLALRLTYGWAEASSYLPTSSKTSSNPETGSETELPHQRAVIERQGSLSCKTVRLRMEHTAALRSVSAPSGDAGKVLEQVDVDIYENATLYINKSND